MSYRWDNFIRWHLEKIEPALAIEDYEASHDAQDAMLVQLLTEMHDRGICPPKVHLARIIELYRKGVKWTA